MPGSDPSRLRIYEALIAHSKESVVVLAADGRTVFQSPAVKSQLGYEFDELIGRDNYDRIHPDDRPAARARFRAAIAGEPTASPIRLRCRHKDGSWRFLECTTSRVVEESQPFLVVNVRDITAITETTSALRASEHRLDLALELGAMGVTEYDYRTDRLVLSASFTRLMGYEQPPTEPDLSWVLQHVHPEDRSQLAAIFNAIKTPKANEFEALFRMMRDGRIRWWFGRVRVMRDERGRPTLAMGLVSDITERRHLEEQVRQSQKLEAVGQLAGGIAHDFNNLLTVIAGYAETLLMSMSTADPRFGDLLEIRRSADRATLLTQQLLAFSRKQILRPQVVDANLVVRDIATMIARVIGRAIQLRVDLEHRPAAVLADRGQLEQVLINLAVNARDAMPDGGLLEMRTRVVALTEDDAARLYPIRPGTYVRLSVRDTGVGMTPEVQARAFEPFFTTKETGKGTGIGLSTVYGIVKQSDGFIFLSSEPGEGTRFDIYLPMADAVAEEFVVPTESDLESHGPAMSTTTVLLVEDYRRVRELARKVLARQGYQVLTAESGHEALEVAEAHDGEIDVIVTDVVMPGMSGPELVRRLLVTRPATAVVYMSGYAGEVLDRQGVDPDEAVFLGKPFTPAALSRKVRDVLIEKTSGD